MENNKTPSIRFKGFTDPWEQRKFGDGMDLLTGFPFESEKFSDNGINLIRGMNVKRGYLDLSDSLCMKWKSSEGLEKYLLENEDILIQMDGALIGKSYAKIKESQLPALLVQRVTRARAIPEDSNSDFMYQTIQRDFLKYIILNKTDSAVPHLSLNDIREFPIRVPNLEEQKKIGEYLYNLDNLIALHQRKYDKLLNIKKSMLEKMFPKNGSNIPEIRFKGFTDPWEQRKLGDDLVSIHTGTNLLGSTTNTGMPLIKMGNIQRGYFDTSKVEFLAENEQPDNEDIANYGDFFFNTRNTLELVGKGATWMKSSGEYVFNSNIARFELRNIDTIFFNYLYNTETMTRQIHTRAMGTTSVAAIYPRTLESVGYLVPCMKEQQKIGAYFKHLDHLITLHQRELEKLQNIKKSMLEKMFV